MGSSLSKNDGSILEESNSKYVKQIIEAREKLTGWERLQSVFKLDEYGAISPELQRVLFATMLAFAVGGGVGAMGRGRIAYQNFMRSNAHEAFQTPLEARRKLQDSVTLGMGSGAYRLSWRIGLFTGMFMTVSTGVSTYRGKMGVMDQVFGAGVAGFIYKFPHGPKASIAGGFFGTLLGLFAGLMTFGLTKLTGQSIDSANMYYYHSLAKKELKRQASQQDERKLLDKIDRKLFDDDGLSRFHDELLKSPGFIKQNEVVVSPPSSPETSNTTKSDSNPSNTPVSDIPSKNSSSNSTEVDNKPNKILVSSENK